MSNNLILNSWTISKLRTELSTRASVENPTFTFIKGYFNEKKITRKNKLKTEKGIRTQERRTAGTRTE